MPFAVRIWPIEIDPDVPLGDWGPLRYAGTFGEDAPWRFEPSYWDVGPGLPGLTPVRVEPYVAQEFEVSRDELRDLDVSFRPRAVGALAWQQAQFEEMDRATAATSPFTRFRIAVYEWESGLE